MRRQNWHDLHIVSGKIYIKSLALTFDSTVSEISKCLKEQGVEKAAYAAIRRFQTLQEDAQQNIMKRVTAQFEQMRLLNPAIKESEKLRMICDYNNLIPATNEVYGRLGNDQPWEIVDFSLHQIYRSHRIFELGHYSLEEYETFSPWELFNRPEAVLKKLIQITEKLKTSHELVDLTGIGPYVIEEALSTARAQFEIVHDFVCPLKDAKTGENKAFVSAFFLKKLNPEYQNKLLMLS
jgi:hypothetical protein